MLLIAGGAADPHIGLLARRVAERDLPHRALLVLGEAAPTLAWDLAEDRLTLEGEAIAPAALFLRHDVFAHMADGRARTQIAASRWHQTLLAWGLAHPAVAMPNRLWGARHATKPLALVEARRAGLAVPETLIATIPMGDPRCDAPPWWADPTRWVAKPVNGGALTRPLEEALADPAWRAEAARAPMLLQRRLVPPELRVYRLGPRRWLAFSVRSAALDYRGDPRPRLALAAAPPGLTAALGVLMDRLGLDFGAADFKTCPESGQPLFLEVNSAPMFAAFDRVAGTALCDAILDWLVEAASGG